jgi:hypothetical protein
MPRASAVLSDRKFCAHEASESTDTFYFNHSTNPSSIGSCAVAGVVGGSRVFKAIMELLLQLASERGKEAAGGRGGAGAVAQARDGPPGLVARPWAGGGPAARQPRDGEAAGRMRPDCTSAYYVSYVSDMRG